MVLAYRLFDLGVGPDGDRSYQLLLQRSGCRRLFLRGPARELSILLGRYRRVLDRQQQLWQFAFHGHDPPAALQFAVGGRTSFSHPPGERFVLLSEPDSLSVLGMIKNMREILDRLGFEAISREDRPYLAEDFVFQPSDYASGRELRNVHEDLVLEESPLALFRQVHLQHAARAHTSLRLRLALCWNGFRD